MVKQKEIARNWALLGLPDHTAVMALGGRIGAAGGPRAFREQWRRLSGKALVHASCQDLGDLQVSDLDSPAIHATATSRISEAQRKHSRTVVVGGAHDLGFPHLQGVRSALRAKRLGCLNLDAHLDLRPPTPLITSGSPFHLAIEGKVLDPSRLLEFGIQSHCNAASLWDYAERKKIQVIGMDRLRRGRAVPAFAAALTKLARKCDSVVVSLDLDCLAAAHAPGVSAPQAEGFTGSEIVEMMEIAGANAKVVSLGIFELNPEHDVDHATARLAATSAWHFIEAWLGKSGRA
ncbi:MAG: formimidoylglutamase [Bdellovibrionales bacterium]|nr:formimidoylglutamase [Bdellovibrionales bacterium]